MGQDPKAVVDVSGPRKCEAARRTEAAVVIFYPARFYVNVARCMKFKDHREI